MKKKSFILPFLTFICLCSCASITQVTYIGEEAWQAEMRTNAPVSLSKEFHVDIHPSFPLTASNEFKAGIAETDITPWAGISMGGFGPLALDGRGFGLRLHAKAFYFEDEHGQGLVFVTADLSSMPAGLADSIASIVAKDSLCRNIGRERILIAASHTHQSPGSFSSSLQYNTFASNWHFFDSRLFQFLAVRIASAITQAVHKKESAVISFGQLPVLGLARNRSMPAFRNNNPVEVTAFISEHENFFYDKNSPKDFPDTDSFRAIDPTLSALIIRSRLSNKILGIASFIACHPISMGAKPPIYNSDFFGYACLKTQKLMSDHPIVGIFNGAEGDVTSNYYEENWADCVRLGETLSKAILNCVENSSAVQSHDLASHYEISTLAGVCLDGFCSSPKSQLGASALGGSEESRTFDFVSKLKDTTGCFEFDLPQGKISIIPGQPPKIPAQSKLPIIQNLIMKIAVPFVPRVVPIGLYEIGNLLIVSLPGEFSTVLGRHLRDSLAKTSIGKNKVTLFSGLGNEYLSYFTTEEEYDKQQYEGASMLYGKYAGKIINHTIVKAAERFDSAVSLPKSTTFLPGIKKDVPIDHLSTEADPQKFLGCFLITAQRYARIDWEDDPLKIPDDSSMLSAQINPEITFNFKNLKAGNDSLSNRNSIDIITFVRAASKTGSKWSAYWLIPEDKNPEKEITVTIKALNGRIETKKTSITLSR
jgi:neutral ceramidase